MRPDIAYLRQRFEHFNALIFGGRLPACDLRIVEARSFMGNCRSKMRVLSDGRRERFGFVIQLSCSFDRSERELDDTIIHEMIHYFIGLHGLPDSSPHGEIFMSLARRINAAYGRNITVSTHAAQPEGSVRRRRRCVVVCVIAFADGSNGIKVLPRQADTIARYRLAVMRSSEPIASLSFFVSEHPFFDPYPASGALRYHKVDAGALARALKDAVPFQPRG